jgi:hypothetical protein
MGALTLTREVVQAEKVIRRESRGGLVPLDNLVDISPLNPFHIERWYVCEHIADTETGA